MNAERLIDAEVAQRVRALKAMGLTRKGIAQKLGLSARQVKRALEGETAAPAKTAMRRPCLCCGQPFMSEGPMNRLCGRCRSEGLTVFDAPANILR